jgi:hypothetical protein
MDNLFSHKLFFYSVLRDIERFKWKDFDYHREKYTSCLNRIKNIKWCVVDKEKYEKIFKKNTSDGLSMLRSSRYGHLTYKKCFPSPSKCFECYKYFCACCDDGTNSMYGESCMNKRCSTTINKYYTDIFNIESIPQNVYMYTSSDTFFREKQYLCPREIYGI